MRPCNDEITQVFEWLYIGGVKNTRKTIPLVEVWIDFKWDTSEPKKLRIPEDLIVHHMPFDDGNLEEALENWRNALELVVKYKTENKKIFISCYEGVSRSAVFVLWLCCLEYGNFDEALKHLKTRRNIFPDKKFEPFINYLKENFN